MTPLLLRGPARLQGIAHEGRRTLLRLRGLGDTLVAPEDALLVRSEDDLGRASASGAGTMVFVGLDGAGLDWASDRRTVVLDGRYSYLQPNDVVAVDARLNRISTLWRTASRHNAFLVTERCDHLCLMCSQPPRDVDDEWLIDEIHDCLPLLDPETASVGFTGGEALLDWRRFVGLLAAVRDRLPEAGAHVLSNGRAFARSEVVAAWAGLRHPDLWAGIPIYSAIDTVHDHIVQSRGALDETVIGIMKLKNAGQRVEVRVVLHALTVPRLAETCTWLARNLPFLDHVALMGMEDTGFALANHPALWIDPVDYRDSLEKGVGILAAAGVRTSIYNLPLCLLSDKARPHAVRSISDWKNDVPEVCSPCEERTRCPGFFTTGRPRLSRGILPFKLPLVA